MGQSPGTDAVSLRTFNRNFYGRSGTLSAKVYLVSPETAAVSAITGVLTDPMEMPVDFENLSVGEFITDDSMIIKPAEDGDKVEVERGPNIKPFPLNKELTESVSGKAVLKVGDNITTDHIMPSNAKLLPYRSNIPYLSGFCFSTIDDGQGSSREHAALAPLYLGIKGVIVKSFARIHKANLINSGIIPMVFENPDDYDIIDQMDDLVIDDAINIVESGKITVKDITKGFEFDVVVELSNSDVEVIKAGGKLNYTNKTAN